MSTANDPADAVRMTFRVADGVTLAGDSFGPADGPLVLFLHGGGQTRHSWKATGALLASNGLHAVLLDARGHGDSDWAPDGDYSRHALAADLDEVLRQLAAPAVVVGASMGGLTALHAAPRLGVDRMAGLVLVDVVPRVERAGVDRIIGFLTDHRDGFDTLDDAAAAVAAYLPHRPRPQSHDGLKRNLRLREDGRWYWHWDPSFVADRGENMEAQMEQLEESARQLRIPVLLVRGRLSDVVSPEGVARFRELVPHVQVAELGGAAHTAAGDDNDAFSGVVSDFVVAATRGG